MLLPTWNGLCHRGPWPRGGPSLRVQPPAVPLRTPLGRWRWRTRVHGRGCYEEGPWASAWGPPRPPRRCRGCCWAGRSDGGAVGTLHGGLLRCGLTPRWDFGEAPGQAAHPHSGGCFGRGPGAAHPYGARRAAGVADYLRLGRSRAVARPGVFGCCGPDLDHGPSSLRLRTGHLLQCRRGSRHCRHGPCKERPSKAPSLPRRHGGVSTETWHWLRRARSKAQEALGRRPGVPAGDIDGSAPCSDGPAGWNGSAATGAQPLSVHRGCGSSSAPLGRPPGLDCKGAADGASEARPTAFGQAAPLACCLRSRGVLAQSQALTSLVQQLATASADPVLDLGAAGSVGVRGASQRAHFQDELAQGKGVFFRQVLQNLARRMAPSQAVTGSPASMLEQGLTLSRYWERFGGWSNARDMALVAYQVGLIFDAMMAERCELAKDHLALLAVSLEQSSLDGSRMDIGYQLTWLEEPPSSMFMARSSHNPRGRAFAPLASQRWITVVLAFLKELDTIQARRGDRPGGSGLVCPGSCPTPAAYSDQLGPNEALQAQVAQSISTTISFADFSASLPRWLLRSRTPFGAFVASTFSSPCGRLGNAPASAVLPLPLPYLALFECSGPRLPRAKWRRLRSRRLLHIMVCAVNFVFCRGSRPSQEALWRAPNTHQRNCYVRLGAFITACESREDRFPLPPGRSGFDLLARLLELEAFASSVLGSSSYAGPAGPSREEPLHSDAPPVGRCVVPASPLPRLCLSCSPIGH